MKKYWTFYKVGLQDTLTYRGPILIWLLTDILSLITILAVWFSTSASNTIAGYTKPDLIAYYVLGLFLRWLLGWYPFYGIKEEIKDGSIILSTLVKPVSLFWRKFAEEVGWHVVGVSVAILVSGFTAFFFRQYINLKIAWTDAVFLLLSVGLAIFVVFTCSLCMGLLAFWFTEVSAVDSLFWAARAILGGVGLPISFIPGIFQTMVRFLPFRYMFSFPLEIYFGRLSHSEMMYGLAAQIIWIFALSLIYRLLWERGRRAYEAFGQ